MIYKGLLLLIVLALNVLATRKLLRSKRLLEQTKRIHIILVWLIPLIWSILVLVYSDEPPKKSKKYEKHRYMRSGYQSYVSKGT